MNTTNICVEKHPLIDGLFVVVCGSLKIYFEFVGYDLSEQCLVFERGDEVVTGRITVDTEAQLQQWKDTFEAMTVELEFWEG